MWLAGRGDTSRAIRFDDPFTDMCFHRLNWANEIHLGAHLLDPFMLACINSMFPHSQMQIAGNFLRISCLALSCNVREGFFLQRMA